MISNEKKEAFKKMTNSGELYDSVDEEFIEYQHMLVQKINEFNNTPDTPEGLKMRDEILKDALGTYGENLYVIDLGPYGGNEGGEIIFTGTPGDIISNNQSLMGKYLRQRIEKNN